MRLGIGLGVDHQGVGVGAVGDPHLGAVEHVAVALLVGAQLHADHVGAGARLAHRQRADVLAGNQLGQVLGFLRGGAVAVDLVHAQIGVRAVGQADRGAGAGDFLHRHHVGQVAHVGAAVFLADGHAQHAQVPELAPQIHRELVAAVDFGGARGDLGGRESAHRIAQHIQVFAQVEVQSGKIHRCLRDSRYLHVLVGANYRARSVACSHHAPNRRRRAMMHRKYYVYVNVNYIGVFPRQMIVCRSRCLSIIGLLFYFETLQRSWRCPNYRTWKTSWRCGAICTPIRSCATKSTAPPRWWLTAARLGHRGPYRHRQDWRGRRAAPGHVGPRHHAARRHGRPADAGGKPVRTPFAP